jgi:heterodisulfide reductase subunit A-like polyferredoxin/coenzyme F420-reducing hydrogenase delta subunit
MKGSILVVGAGPAGMRASSELLQQGFKVYLVEEKPTIGGKMAQIDKMFPTNECATCTVLPHMLELTNNPNLVLLAYAEVQSVKGAAGDFKVKVVKKPRYVDPTKCTACTDCFPVCPVGGIPMEFNLGRGASKAIFFYSPFPPRKALIDPQRCDYILKGKCGEKEKPPCVEACKPDAIVFSQKPTEVELNVGAIILATGLDEVRNEQLLGKYGYKKIPNVLTALEYERLLSGLGPTGGIVKRNDGRVPHSLSWLVLDESSPMGIMTAVTQALGSIEKNPEAFASIFYYKDVPLVKDSYYQFYSTAKERNNISFAHTGSVTIASSNGGEINLSFVGKEGSTESMKPEMLILVLPLTGSSSVQRLAKDIGLRFDKQGFLSTPKEGIFVCGGATGPRGIDDSIIQSCSAAGNAAALLAPARGTELAPPPKKELMPVKAQDEPNIAVVICRCGLNIAGFLDIDELARYTASLPYVKQVEITPFGCDGVALKRLLGGKKFNRIVMGACSPKTHEPLFELHSEIGGLNRHLLEIVNIRNHCTWVHSKNKADATRKAKTLMRMGVSRAALLEPLEDIYVPVTSSCLVVGCTPGGISCASTLARMGFKVYVVEIESNPLDIKENQNPFIESIYDKLKADGKVKIFAGAKLGTVEGFIGNFKAEIVKPYGREIVEVGSIVIASERKMGISLDGADYEKALNLNRNEKGFFISALGIMNRLDFNTEGIFMCGSARTLTTALEQVIEGEATASRVAGIITKKQIIKSPRISFVVNENCDGCAYCVEPCPAHGITLLEYVSGDGIKKTVEINEAICKGCGICMATCPKKGIYVRHFKPDHFSTMTNSIPEKDIDGKEFEPRVLTFCCNWCSYAAADAAGTARLQYPSNIYIVRVMCSGMVHPNMVIDPLTKGIVDGVMICGCHLGDCHYQTGNEKAKSRADAIRLMLGDLGLEEERFRLEWVSASEGPKFAKVAAEMTETIRKLGPNPYRTQ